MTETGRVPHGKIYPIGGTGVQLDFKMILLHGRILRGFPFGNDISPPDGVVVRKHYRGQQPPTGPALYRPQTAGRSRI